MGVVTIMLFLLDMPQGEGIYLSNPGNNKVGRGYGFPISRHGATTQRVISRLYVASLRELFFSADRSIHLRHA